MQWDSEGSANRAARYDCSVAIVEQHGVGATAICEGRDLGGEAAGPGVEEFGVVAVGGDQVVV